MAVGHYKVVNGPMDFYFGHISYVEAAREGTDPVVLRASGRSEGKESKGSDGGKIRN
jgi:hypothetical protein